MSVAVLRHEASTGLGRFAELFGEHGVDYEVVWTTRGRLPDPRWFDGALVLGGSMSANDSALAPARAWIRDAMLSDLPYLGVCLGGQLLAGALGAPVERTRPEVGVHNVYLTRAGERDAVFSGLPRRLPVFSFHGESFGLPVGAVPLAGSIACTYQAFRYGESAFGLQFHPEVRAADLVRWQEAAGYSELVARSGGTFAELSKELELLDAYLDRLAAHLLECWLTLLPGGETQRRLASHGPAATLRVATEAP
jgi:GMP synthase-like glutamine amidotransferase